MHNLDEANNLLIYAHQIGENMESKLTTAITFYNNNITRHHSEKLTDTTLGSSHGRCIQQSIVSQQTRKHNEYQTHYLVIYKLHCKAQLNSVSISNYDFT